MSLKNKLNTAFHAGRMAWDVTRNAGKIPVSKHYMVTIESTSVCNLACPLCPTGTGTLKRTNKYIPMRYVHKIVDLTAPLAQGFVISVFGEPTFHPELDKLLAATSHLPTWLSTNLNYDTDTIRELAQWENLKVICSIDTLDSDKYPKYRINGDYQKVLANLKLLAKGLCQVYPQFLVSENEYDEETFVRFADEYGVAVDNLIIKTKLENFRLDETSKPKPGKCHSCYTGIYFNCDGYQVPCCNNVRKDLFIQHLDKISSTKDLIGSNEICKMRKALAENKNTYPSCGQCNGLNFWKEDFPGYINGLASVFQAKSTSEPQRVLPNGQEY